MEPSQFDPAASDKRDGKKSKGKGGKSRDLGVMRVDAYKKIKGSPDTDERTREEDNIEMMRALGMSMTYKTVPKKAAEEKETAAEVKTPAAAVKDTTADVKETAAGQTKKESKGKKDAKPKSVRFSDTDATAVSNSQIPEDDIKTKEDSINTVHATKVIETSDDYIDMIEEFSVMKVTELLDLVINLLTEECEKLAIECCEKLREELPQCSNTEASLRDYNALSDYSIESFQKALLSFGHGVAKRLHIGFVRILKKFGDSLIDELLEWYDDGLIIALDELKEEFEKEVRGLTESALQKFLKVCDNEIVEYGENFGRQILSTYEDIHEKLVPGEMVSEDETHDKPTSAEEQDDDTASVKNGSLSDMEGSSLSPEKPGSGEESDNTLVEGKEPEPDKEIDEALPAPEKSIISDDNANWNSYDDGTVACFFGD